MSERFLICGGLFIPKVSNMKKSYDTISNWIDEKDYKNRHFHFCNLTEINFKSKPKDERWFTRVYDLENNPALGMYGGIMVCYVLKKPEMKWSVKHFLNYAKPIMLSGKIESYSNRGLQFNQMYHPNLEDTDVDSDDSDDSDDSKLSDCGDRNSDHFVGF